MKKYSLFLIALFLSASAVLPQTANQKTGYVDSQVILTALPEAIKAQGDLDAFIKQWNAVIDSMTTDLQTSYEAYQKQAATMTPEKNREAQQQLILKEQEINQFRQRKFGQPNGEFYQKQDQLLAPVKEKIIKGIEEIAKEEGMDFIFDKSGDILLLYANNAYDITFKVLDRLKRGKTN